MSPPHPHKELLERAQRWLANPLGPEGPGIVLVRLLVSALTEGAEESEACQACGDAYTDVYWIEDDAAWETITPKPEHPGAGRLCPNCATNRLAVALAEANKRIAGLEAQLAATESQAAAAITMTDAERPIVQSLTEQVEAIREAYVASKTGDPNDRDVQYENLRTFAAAVRAALTTTPEPPPAPKPIGVVQDRGPVDGVNDYGPLRYVCTATREAVLEHEETHADLGCPVCGRSVGFHRPAAAPPSSRREDDAR